MKVQIRLSLSLENAHTLDALLSGDLGSCEDDEVICVIKLARAAISLGLSRLPIGIENTAYTCARDRRKAQ